MAKHTYTIVLLTEQEGGYSILVPGLPGCCTMGATIPECLAMAAEAIGLVLECMQDHGDPIPEDPEDITFQRYESDEGHWFRVTVEV